MSKSGTYMVRDGKVVKVSDKIPNLISDVTFTEHRHGEQFVPELATEKHPHGQWCSGRKDKKRKMAECHVAQVSRV